MQKIQLNKQGKPQTFKKVQLGVLGKPLSGTNQMNFDYSDSKSFIALYESQRRREEDQFEKKSIFKSKQMKERTLKNNLYYIDQQIIQKELNEISLTNTRAEFDKKSSIQNDEFLFTKQIQAAQFIQCFNEQVKGQVNKQLENNLNKQQENLIDSQQNKSIQNITSKLLPKQQQLSSQQQFFEQNSKNGLQKQEQQMKGGAGEVLITQSQTFNRKEMHILKLKNKNQSSKIDENQEYQQSQQCEQNQGLFQIKRKVTNYQVNSKSDIQTRQLLQYDRVKSPTQLNEFIVINTDFKYLKNQKQVTFSSTPQQAISLKHSLSSLDVAPTTQKFKQNSTHQKINTQVIQAQQEINQDISRKQSLQFTSKLNQCINDQEKPFQVEEQILELESNDLSMQKSQTKQSKIDQSENNSVQSQIIQQENQGSLISIMSPLQQNENEQQEKISKNKQNSIFNDKIELQNSSEVKNDQQIYFKYNFSFSQNIQNTTIQKSNINMLDQTQNTQYIQKKSSDQTQNQKKIQQKKQQRAEEKKTNIINTFSKKQNNSSNRSFFLPNNFIVILEKGFSLFTYHFSEKFMQDHILTFLTIFDCMSLRLVNKELYKRANKILFLRSQREQLVIEKKILKSTYRSQISDFIENQLQDLVQIIESFEDIQESDYSEFMQMVIPPQNLLIVLHIFLSVFGKQTVGIESLLDNKGQWKRVMTVCFVKGGAKEQIQRLSQKANLEQLHELLPKKIYEQVREQISENDFILSQLTIEKYPFLFKLFTFVEKILDLYEILCLKYPNVIKFIELLKQIKNDPEIRVLSCMDDKFCNNFELI
ncbi:hypothetical protein ABPG72_016929 [Tetrahymena utriculariae]